MKPYQGFHHLKAGCIGIALLPVWLGVSTVAAPFQLVSVPGSGFAPAAGGDGDSTLPILSRDGRFVLFASTANNLVSLGSNQPTAQSPAHLNVFLRDRVKGSTVLVSANLANNGGGDADSIPIGVSTNGRYALFESTASNLVPGDTNNAGDVFVRDLESGVTSLVSAGPSGVFGDNSSYNSAITPDGRYVAFASAAANLVAGDTNGIPDVFVRDLESNTTSLVSIGAQERANSLLTAESDAPFLTPDGRYVLFYSTAANLAPGVQTAGDLYLRDRLTGDITWVSSAAKPMLGALGSVTNTVSFNAALSDDGQFVAFEAMGFPAGKPAAILRYSLQTGLTDLIETNAVPAFTQYLGGIADIGMTPDGRFVAYVANALDASGSTTAIRVWDAHTGTSVLASGNLTNVVAAGTLSDGPGISDNGRFIAFVSGAADLVTNDVPGDFHAYLRDLQTATTMLLDADTNGVGSLIDASSGVVMSADGRTLAFDSQDGSLVAADRNHSYDVFLRDRDQADAEIISVHDSALASRTSDGPSFCSSFGVSPDGRFLVFWSDADDLIADDTNGQRDVFVRDMTAGTTSVVSVNTNGAVGDNSSTDGAISTDGRYVAFTSLADDLVPADGNRAQDVFVRDRVAGTTVLVSVNAAGTGPGNADSYSPLMASDGQAVLFRSRAGTLTTPGTLAGTENLFWRDLRLNRTFALSTNGVVEASMTPDGSLVAYTATSSKLLPSGDRLFIWSSQSNAFLYGLSGVGLSSIVIGSDGNRFAYVTNDASVRRLIGIDRALNTNFVIASYVSSVSGALRFDPSSRYLGYVGTTGVVSGVTQVYLYDFETGSNQLVSRGYDGFSPGNGNSDSVDISFGGRFVTYRSVATNLVPRDTNGLPDVFMYDRVSGATTLVSASRFGNGSADHRSLAPAFSQDGRTLVFTSWASDLVPGDFNNNSDVFSLSIANTGVGAGFYIVALADTSGSGSTWLTWPCVLGTSYRAQFKNALNDVEWQDLGQPVSVVGEKAYVQDPAQGASTRFYRVMAY